MKQNYCISLDIPVEAGNLKIELQEVLQHKYKLKAIQYGQAKSTKLLFNTEECEVDNALQNITSIIDLPGFSDFDIDIHVRNLLNSEPTSGSDDYSDTFSPVPGISIVPWSEKMPVHSPENSIILDPGYSFGTGKHPTTILCLKFLKALEHRSFFSSEDKSVLDIGCGSGILALTCLKLGAHKATGVEIDRDSVNYAQRNSVLNHYEKQFEIYNNSIESIPPATYSLVIANLVTSVMLNTCSGIRNYVQENGYVIVSGFGDKQASDMEIFYYENGLQIIEKASLKNWCAFLMKKK